MVESQPSFLVFSSILALQKMQFSPRCTSCKWEIMYFSSSTGGCINLSESNLERSCCVVSSSFDVASVTGVPADIDAFSDESDVEACGGGVETCCGVAGGGEVSGKVGGEVAERDEGPSISSPSSQGTLPHCCPEAKKALFSADLQLPFCF